MPARGEIVRGIDGRGRAYPARFLALWAKILILARFSTRGGSCHCNRARTGRAKRGTAGAWRQQARDSARAPVRAHCSLISKVQFSVSSLLQLFFFQNFCKIFVKFIFKIFNFSKFLIYFLILQNFFSNFARNLRGAGAIC